MKLLDYLYISLYGYYFENGFERKAFTPQTYTTYVITAGMLLWLWIILIYPMYLLGSFSYYGIGVGISGIFIYIGINMWMNKEYVKSNKYQALYDAYKGLSASEKKKRRNISFAVILLLPLLGLLTLGLLG